MTNNCDFEEDNICGYNGMIGNMAHNDDMMANMSTTTWERFQPDYEGTVSTLVPMTDHTVDTYGYGQ